jgi:hypothetical protein
LIEKTTPKGVYSEKGILYLSLVINIKPSLEYGQAAGIDYFESFNDSVINRRLN